MRKIDDVMAGEIFAYVMSAAILYGIVWYGLTH